MKKLLAVILALSLCLSLCSCGLAEKVNAVTLYAKAASTLSEAKSFEASCTMCMAMDVMGMNMDLDFDINMKVDGKNMQMSMSLLGQDITMTLLDKTMYMDMMGQSVKYSVEDTDKAGSEIMDDTIARKLPEIALEVLEATEITENEDGTKELTVALTNEQSSELMGLANSMYEGMAFENVMLTLKFDSKNQLSGFSVDGTFSASEADITVGGDLAVDYEFVSIGEAVEIALPVAEEEYTDGGKYEELNEGLLG